MRETSIKATMGSRFKVKMELLRLIIFMGTKSQETKWTVPWWSKWTIKTNNLRTLEATWTRARCFRITQVQPWRWVWRRTVEIFRRRWILCLGMMEVLLDRISQVILIWATAALNIWNQTFICRFRVRLSKHQIICSRRCKELCMIRIRALSSSRIILRSILRIRFRVSRRVPLCCHMHQELKPLLKLLGLHKRRPNKRTKNDTCQCSNKTAWSTCQCPAKTKRDQLRNMSTVTYKTILTQWRWCKIMWVYYNNLLQSAQKEIDNKLQSISNHMFHTRPLTKLLSKQSNRSAWTTHNITIVSSKQLIIRWRTVLGCSRIQISLRHQVIIECKITQYRLEVQWRIVCSPTQIKTDKLRTQVL